MSRERSNLRGSVAEESVDVKTINIFFYRSTHESLLECLADSLRCALAITVKRVEK